MELMEQRDRIDHAVWSLLAQWEIVFVVVGDEDKAAAGLKGIISFLST